MMKEMGRDDKRDRVGGLSKKIDGSRIEERGLLYLDTYIPYYGLFLYHARTYVLSTYFAIMTGLPGGRRAGALTSKHGHHNL